MTPGKKFPDEVIKYWPEVFGEITLNVVPLQYLESITVTFKNKKVWEIKNKSLKEINYNKTCLNIWVKHLQIYKNLHYPFWRSHCKS